MCVWTAAILARKHDNRPNPVVMRQGYHKRKYPHGAFAAPPRAVRTRASLNPDNRSSARACEEPDEGGKIATPHPNHTQLRSRPTAARATARNDSLNVGLDRFINQDSRCKHGCTCRFARPVNARLGLSLWFEFASRLLQLGRHARAAWKEEPGQLAFVA